MNALSEDDKVISTFFPGFVFCASTTNTGGRVATPPHVDAKNVVFGICSVMAFGDFDHTTSGQLVLEELKVSQSTRPFIFLSHGRRLYSNFGQATSFSCHRPS